MTRDKDVNPGGSGQSNSLKARVKVSEEADADIFVSIHVDAAAYKDEETGKIKTNPKADRVTVYTKNEANEQSKKLSENLKEGLSKAVVSEQGVKQKTANHYVTRKQNASVAAVLIEIGFMTNGTQESLMNSDEYLRIVADAIATAIFYTAHPDPTTNEAADNQQSGTTSAPAANQVQPQDNLGGGGDSSDGIGR